MEFLVIDFLQLSTGSFAAESFGTLFYLQFCAKWEYINMPVYNLT